MFAILKNYILQFYKKEDNNINNNIDNNTFNKKEKELKFDEFKKTDIYKKQIKKINLKMKKTEEEVAKIKKLKQKIIYKIDFIKENVNLKELEQLEQDILQNYFNFCYYYITNFSNLKTLKILNTFLNYVIRIYVSKKQIKNMNKFKKQVNYFFNLINKKLEASRIFKNTNIIVHNFNNFLMQNKQLLNTNYKEIDKHINKILKIEDVKDSIKQKKKEVKEIDEVLTIARNFLNDLDKKLNKI